MKKLYMFFICMLVIGLVNGSAEATPLKTYTVKEGDNLYRISLNHHTTVDKLKELNGLDTTVIHPGQQLKVVESDKKVQTKVEASFQEIPTASTQSPTLHQEQVVDEVIMEATAYTAYCTGCSGITKTGQDLRANPDMKVIAVDPNVIPLGTKVFVDGYGYAIAGDIGSAIKGSRIDVFIPTRDAALEWGRQNVKVKILQ